MTLHLLWLRVAHANHAHPSTVLRKVRHKHVVQLIGACTVAPKLCIVTEFMRRGSLLDYLHRHHPLRPGLGVKLSLDVAKGMDYLHQCNISASVTYLSAQLVGFLTLC